MGAIVGGYPMIKSMLPPKLPPPPPPIVLGDGAGDRRMLADGTEVYF